MCMLSHFACRAMATHAAIKLVQMLPTAEQHSFVLFVARLSRTPKARSFPPNHMLPHYFKACIGSAALSMAELSCVLRHDRNKLQSSSWVCRLRRWLSDRWLWSSSRRCSARCRSPSRPSQSLTQRVPSARRRLPG